MSLHGAAIAISQRCGPAPGFKPLVVCVRLFAFPFVPFPGALYRTMKTVGLVSEIV